MEWLFFIPVVVFILLIFLKKLAANAGGDTNSQSSLGYRKKKTLFTEAERSFLGVLDKCLDASKYRVFGKVRVADILEPNPTKNRSEWSRAFGRIKAKHFDYVICAADTLKPVCAIELDDKSHNQKKRQQRDQLLESVCKDTSLPLIRVPAKRSYKPEEVKALLAKRFASAAGGGERSVGGPASNARTKPVASKLKKKTKAESEQKSEVLVKTEEADVPVGEIGGAVR